MNELRLGVEPELFERGRARFERVFKFLTDCCKRENDYNLAVERLVLLHFGVAINSSIVEYRPLRGRFGQRFAYLHALVGAAYFEYESFGAALEQKIDHLYEGIDPALVQHHGDAFERDLAFLVQAARSNAEMAEAFGVLAKLHFDNVIDEGGNSGRNQEVRQRLEHIFEQHRPARPRMARVA